ncbi:hypothetical protein GOP47_0011673 [Adiantum capillus-veneris]|uniref:Uncharacterized protein n=1 Tax=Adiantum capillus-veneris TaxID=13818 RepID=A0A9D4ZHW4_ADICA|nr:hypothetical protein GOP47_0011673 [Adiantum capillus-veneris]
MGRAPCCEKDSVKRGPWTPEEDAKLLSCVAQHGTGSWRTLPKKAGLQRCGKSCRLRWTNYLRPDLKHGRFSDHEEQTIVKLHAALGSRWSLIAAQLPGRTDNDVKNYWNTRLKKKLCEMGIDPITHKPISQLLADLAGSMGAMAPMPSQTGSGDSVHSTSRSPNTAGCCMQITDVALGCFKDDMLNVIMRCNPSSMPSTSPLNMGSPIVLSAPGASSSTSSPTTEAVFDRPHLQPFLRPISPFLQTSSKLVNHVNMPYSLSLSCPLTSRAVGAGKEGLKEATYSTTTHNNILHSNTSPSSTFPPYLRFLNPPPTSSPLALSNNIASPCTSIPFFLHADSLQTRSFSNRFNNRPREDAPHVRSMIDMQNTSTPISGSVPKRSTIANEEAANTLHAQRSTPQMEHNYSISNHSSLANDAEKFLTSQADLQSHIAEPHPWFSNVQEEQHADKEVQNHAFNWQNDEEAGNHRSRGDCNSTVAANWSPTCTSRSSSTCSNLPGPLDMAAATTHHQYSSSHMNNTSLTDQPPPLTSVDAILWDLSDLNAFIS